MVFKKLKFIHNCNVTANLREQGETIAPVTPPAITENTKQYSRIEIDPQQQHNIPAVCFYAPAPTSAPVSDPSPYQYLYQPSIYPSQGTLFYIYLFINNY